MSGSIIDDMRDEARSARLLDTRAEHPATCRCHECQRDAYVPGDDTDGRS